MKEIKLRRRAGSLLVLLLVVSMTFGSIPAFAASGPAAVSGVQAAGQQAVETALNDTAAYIYQTVKKPQVGSIGGEWAVLGLARSEYEVPKEYYQDYYNTVVEYVKASKGVLHEKKYTEYSRVTVALTAIGANPTDVGGYNLLTPLGDFDKAIWQGINGPIWALIALDSGNYEMPKNTTAKTQATRQMYIDEILSRQLPDGGFSLFGDTAEVMAGDGASDPDVTGMALQALAKYQDQPKVKKVTEEALACLSKMQKSNGGFASGETSTLESSAQVVVALAELGIPFSDSRFVKNGNSAVDNLLAFYQKGKGFFHTDGSGSNQMATEQGFYGLVAADRAQKGKNSLYRMDDASAMISEKTQEPAPGASQVAAGLPAKNSDVRKQGVTVPDKTFSDISSHKNQKAIEALAAREIVNGKVGDKFMPDDTMTRAEFSTIIVKALGLVPKKNDKFSDVASGSWYAPYVGTAYSYGITNGTPEGKFNPGGTITRQEAVVMVARAAELAGMNMAIDAMTAKDDMDILPKAAIKRGEIAQMLCDMLKKAELL